MDLLDEKMGPEVLIEVLNNLLSSNQVRVRKLEIKESELEDCFYSKSLYYDEEAVANLVKSSLTKDITIDSDRIQSWVSRYCQAKKFN